MGMWVVVSSVDALAWSGRWRRPHFSGASASVVAPIGSPKACSLAMVASTEPKNQAARRRRVALDPDT